MTPEQAQAYHSQQINVLADTEADMITAITMTNSSEAKGLTRAAQAAGMPVVASFTVETDGRPPTGEVLAEAIAAVDRATADGPAYCMISCSHPCHFAHLPTTNERRIGRIRGIRANAPKRSHASLGSDYGQLRRRFPHVTTAGGCRGTDHPHVERICATASGSYCRHAAHGP